ncbi:MAG: hypothetical protein HYV77_03260 [Candidatus Wildermuthbacteria bacterium]|nr:hypothetical protein [Candidatus Wildermuthbacteria bacterium]
MSLEKREVSEPLSIEVNLSEAWDTESEAELLIEALKRAGIYKENLLFCGFNGEKQFRTTGKVFATWEVDLKGRLLGGKDMNPIEYAFDQKKPAIAIIDGDKIDNPPSKGEGWRYAKIKIMDQSVLLAVVFLKR